MFATGIHEWISARKIANRLELHFTWTNSSTCGIKLQIIVLVMAKLDTMAIIVSHHNWWWVNIGSGIDLVPSCNKLYLYQCCPWSSTSYRVTRPQRVNHTTILNMLNYLDYILAFFYIQIVEKELMCWQVSHCADVLNWSHSHLYCRHICV